jgi:hypothetical protein
MAIRDSKECKDKGVPLRKARSDALFILPFKPQKLF